MSLSFIHVLEMKMGYIAQLEVLVNTALPILANAEKMKKYCREHNYNTTARKI